MIEWGNNWARGLTYRRGRNEAFAGYFSQIGRLYNVHHIWCKFGHQMSVLSQYFILFDLVIELARKYNYSYLTGHCHLLQKSVLIVIT